MTLATFAVAVVYLLLKFPHSNGTGCQSVVPIKSVERRENKTYTGKVYSFKSCDIFFSSLVVLSDHVISSSY